VSLSAVFFDFGDTLVSTRLDWGRIRPAMLDSLQDALEANFPDLDFARLKRDYLFLRAEGHKRAERTLKETPAVLSLRRTLTLQGRREVPDSLLQLGVDGYFAPEEAAYSIITGIPETLATLRSLRLRLAVLSNATCGRLIRRALERRMLLPFFEQVLVSAEVGCCKPDRGLFTRALDLLRLPPDQVAMVGDRLPTDIEGARRMNIRSVLVEFLGGRPAGPAPDPGRSPRPDAIVRQPKELIGIFRDWMK
jgi:HAD superfamily hydrolase (TIGR01493 family)